MHATPIFILGFPRSGTTLLRLMLNGHPRISIPPESMYFEHLVRGFGLRMCTAQDVASLGAVIRPNNRWSLDMEKVMHAVEARLPARAPELVEAIYLNWAEQMGESPQFWGSKEPWRIQHFERLARWFPAAQFVHIYRDPRDTIVSRTEHYPDQIPLRHVIPPELTLACHWRHLVEKCRRRGPEVAPGRYIELKYEDLVREPEQVLRRVTEHLKLDYDERMLQYHKTTDDPRVLPRPERRSGAHDHLDAAPTTERVSRFRGQLQGWRLASVEAICRSTMEQLGYESATEQRTMIPRIAAISYKRLFDIAYSTFRILKRLRGGL